MQKICLVRNNIQSYCKFAESQWFRKTVCFRRVNESDHSEIVFKASIILIRDVDNCKIESSFSTQRVWHSECKNWPKHLINTNVRLAEELKNSTTSEIVPNAFWILVLCTLKPYIKEL